MMRIALNAHLLAGAAGYRSAGIHRYIDGLLAHLASAAPDDWRLTAFVNAGVSASYPRITTRPAAFDTTAPSRRILWEQAIQPFHLIGCDLHHALAFAAPILSLTPTVVTVYDLSFIHHPGRLPAARRRYLEQITAHSCARARRVIAISHATAADLSATFGIPADRIDIAQPGCDFAVYRPLAAEAIAAFRARMGLPDRFWLFIGTLEPRKNLVTLIDAYAALPPAARLPLLIGGGKGWDYEPIFAAVDRHKLGDSVRFLGFLTSDDLPFWYNAAEVFLYPSIFEGFGLPVLEALACGTPVIAADASSLPEVVGDVAACVPPQDSAAWRDALSRAADDADWRAAVRDRAVAQALRFTWAHTAGQTVASYRKALARS